jgi:hypothetical protein
MIEEFKRLGMVELDRELFVTLMRDDPTKYIYYIHNDCNFVDKFYAENDANAIKEFRDRIEKHELERS